MHFGILVLTYLCQHNGNIVCGWVVGQPRVGEARLYKVVGVVYGAGTLLQFYFFPDALC